MKHKILSLLFLLPLLLSAGTISLKLDFWEHDAGGFRSAPGSLHSPVRSINILLPYGAEILDYDARVISSRPAAKTFTRRNAAFISSEGIIDAPSQNAPSQRLNYLGPKLWGDLHYASFSYLPFDEASGLWDEKLSISVSYSDPDPRLGQIPATFRPDDFFANQAQMHSWYSSTRNPMGIQVIGSTALYNSFAPWVAFREGQGFSVQFFDISQILANEVGQTSAEKLRNHLITQQVLNPFSYVLLLGDHDVVPIAYLCPEPNGSTSIPSDIYYADLTSDWDTDNDGRLGEYYSVWGEEDYGVDYTPEAFVGRISTNSPAEAAQIANRIVAFEQSNDPFKDKALLPAAWLNYANEPVIGMPETDAALFAEIARASVLRNHQCTTLYEELGLVPSFPSDYALNEDNLNNLIRNEDFGIINWGAHGSAVSSARKIWMADYNDNQIPDNNEMQWQGMVDINSFNNIQSEYGTVLFAASCSNGYLDYHQISLAEKALVNRAVAVIAATRTGWYKVGWENPGWGGLSSYNYHFLENYAEKGYSAGAAHAYANLLHTQYYLFGDPIDDDGVIWPELQNAYTYILFGDPVLGHSDFTEPEGEILVYSPHFDGWSVVNAIRDNADLNVIYSNRLIPDYDYLDSFEAVFCLFDNEVPQAGSFEYNLLNDYLEDGGRIYMEGRINWDMTDPFLSKFGLEAPLDMLVYIENIEAEGQIWAYTNPDFETDVLVPMGESASVLFETANTSYADAVIGVLNAPPGYRTIGSSFHLTEVADGDPGLSQMLGLILRKLEVTEPVSNSDASVPAALPGLRIWPNPSRNLTNIKLENPDRSERKLTIYNIRGQKIRTLLLSAKNGHSTSWNGKDADGKSCPGGVYILKSGNLSKKFSLIR